MNIDFFFLLLLLFLPGEGTVFACDHELCLSKALLHSSKVGTLWALF